MSINIVLRIYAANQAVSQLKVERIYTKQKTRFAREFSIQFVTIGTIPVVRVPAGKIPFINSGSFPVETVPVGTFPFSSVGTFPRGHFRGDISNQNCG